MSNTIYLVTLTVIKSITDRKSITTTIPESVLPPVRDEDIKQLETGWVITDPEEYIKSYYHPMAVNYLHSEDMWGSWMDNWTSITVYRLYTGEQEIRM